MSLLRSHHFLRIGSNYLRMGLGVCLGIALMRLLLRYGEGVFAAFALTASSIGVAEIMKEAIRGATIPELGISYHSGDQDRFKSAFASSLLLSAIAGFFGALVLGLFIVFLGSFEIHPGLESATTTLIATRMASVFVAITLSPIINMLPITGRMVSYNGWLAMDRIAEVAALLAASIFVAPGDGATLLKVFGIGSMVTMCAATVGAAIHASTAGDFFRFDRSHLSGDRLRQVLSSVGWQGAAVASVNLYLRFDVFAVNVFFGVAGTVVFAVASQLAAYTRNVTMGLITGLDAVVSKKAATQSPGARNEIIGITNSTFQLQSLSLFAAGMLLLLHADFVIRLLFGDRLSAPSIQIPLIAQSFTFLMAGMIFRGLSEGWMGVLAGSNRIKNYSLPVLLGSLLNPIFVVAAAKLLSPDAGLASVSVIFMILNFIFHMIVVPAVTARFLRVSFWSIIAPGLAPLIAALACAAAAYTAGRLFASDVHRFLLTCTVLSLTFVPWFLAKFRAFMNLH
jgi:hypothetical protein